MPEEARQAPRTPEAARLLDKAAQELGAAGAARAARRLKLVDELTEELDYPALARLADPKLAEEELTVIGRRRLRVVYAIRNVVIFLPLVWAWLGLGLAAVAYKNELTRDPRSASKPFLALWQEGFSSSSLTFSLFAIISAGLLIVAATMVFFARLAESRESNRQVEVIDDLHTAMGNIAVAIEKSRESEPASSAVRAVSASREAEYVALSAIVDKQGQAVASFLAEASDLRRSTKDVLHTQTQLLAELQETIGGLQRVQRETNDTLRESNASAKMIAKGLDRLAGAEDNTHPAFQPLTGRVSQADRMIASMVTNGHIRSREIVPKYEED